MHLTLGERAVSVDKIVSLFSLPPFEFETRTWTPGSGGKEITRGSCPSCHVVDVKRVGPFGETFVNPLISRRHIYYQEEPSKTHPGIKDFILKVVGCSCYRSGSPSNCQCKCVSCETRKSLWPLRGSKGHTPLPLQCQLHEVQRIHFFGYEFTYISICYCCSEKRGKVVMGASGLGDLSTTLQEGVHCHCPCYTCDMVRLEGQTRSGEKGIPAYLPFLAWLHEPQPTAAVIVAPIPPPPAPPSPISYPTSAPSPETFFSFLRKPEGKNPFASSPFFSVTPPPFPVPPEAHPFDFEHAAHFLGGHLMQDVDPMGYPLPHNPTLSPSSNFFSERPSDQIPFPSGPYY
jgi:hypothetical protein